MYGEMGEMVPVWFMSGQQTKQNKVSPTRAADMLSQGIITNVETIQQKYMGNKEILNACLDSKRFLPQRGAGYPKGY